MPLTSLHDLTFDELERRLSADGVRPAHAARLFRALYQELEDRLESREDFLGPLRRWLETEPRSWRLDRPAQASETSSADGSTRKFLLKLEDAQEIETVLMGYPGRFTACLSTQAGCAMGCVFCATGQMGFVRNLRPGEIVAQVLHVARFLRRQNGGRLRNVVLMGMGEPLQNFDAVMRALEIITDTRGLNLGPARVSVSTVGHVPGIRKLARHPRTYNLAVSLHAASDEERSALVPVNQRWPLAELLDACEEYSALKKGKVFIAWTLIHGKNDSGDHARRLAELLRGRRMHVNLIPLNPTVGFEGVPSQDGVVQNFQRILQEAGLPSTIRQRRGIDVAAGCGQLKAGRVGSRQQALSGALSVGG